MPGQTARDRMTEGLLPPQPSRALVRRELGYFLKRLGLVALFLTAVAAAGSVAFAGFEHTSYWQGVQRAFTTISTLGRWASPRPSADRSPRLLWSPSAWVRCSTSSARSASCLLPAP